MRNIYFNLEFNRRSNISPRDVALLITDEPVIPVSEITENTFKKVASDINNVDLTKCFVHVNYPGHLSNDDSYFLCSVGGYRDDVSMELVCFTPRDVCRIIQPVCVTAYRTQGDCHTHPDWGNLPSFMVAVLCFHHICA